MVVCHSAEANELSLMSASGAAPKLVHGCARCYATAICEFVVVMHNANTSTCFTSRCLDPASTGHVRTGSRGRQYPPTFIHTSHSGDLFLILTLDQHIMPALTTEECLSNASRLADRVVLITGAGSGFGRATAIEFVKHGAMVVLGDIDEKRLSETCSIVQSTAGRYVLKCARG